MSRSSSYYRGSNAGVGVAIAWIVILIVLLGVFAPVYAAEKAKCDAKGGQLIYTRGYPTFLCLSAGVTQ